MNNGNETPKQGPFPQSYWVVPGKLLAGEYPGSLHRRQGPSKVELLLAAGVSAFIDLTHEYDGMIPYDVDLGGAGRSVTREHFPIEDLGVPENPAYTTRILDAIDGHIVEGRIVYVHCWGGIGRTGTIIGCWLARHGFPGQAARVELKRLWGACEKSGYRDSPETREQADYVRAWREDPRQSRRHS
jgi:predicted DNA-binding WGR domain protein